MDAARVLLVADVLGRVVEHLLGDRYLLTVLDHDPVTKSGHTVWAKSLRIRNPTTHADRPDEVSLLDGPHVALEPADAATADHAAQSLPGRLRIGALATPAHAASVLADLRDYEPLAIRLALLRFPYPDEAILSTARLHHAEETLTRWRFKVAGRVNMP